MLECTNSAKVTSSCAHPLVFRYSTGMHGWSGGCCCINAPKVNHVKTRHMMITTRCLACHNSHGSLCFACSAWLPLASDTLRCCSCRVCRSEEAGREEGGQESAVVGCCYLRKCFQTVLWYREVNPSNTRRRGSKRCSRRRYAAASRPQCCRTRAFAPLFLKSGPVLNGEEIACV